ncbi:MAG: type II toxin-antitoxin system HicB family antitoxin [Methanothrix sp.]|nr:type II toxin-antitoxin system HicB family antitoxin [Methanothrix sp.]
MRGTLDGASAVLRCLPPPHSPHGNLQDLIRLKRVAWRPTYFIYLNAEREDCDLMFVLTAVIHKEEEMYIAECPEVGTVSQGFTIEEAVANLKEATELYLEEFPLEGELKMAFVTTFEVPQVAKT